jgi:hypothetical protein
VRAALIGDNNGGWEGLTMKRRRWWRSDGNRRGGRVSGGESRRGRRVGGGEGRRSSSSSSGAVERRAGKRGSGWRSVAFQAPRWRGPARGKKGGGPCGRGHVVEGEGGEGAPGTVVGSAGRPATAPGRRARAAALSHNRGERRGAADVVRARLTGGAGTSRGPIVSGGVREGEG